MIDSYKSKQISPSKYKKTKKKNENKTKTYTKHQILSIWMKHKAKRLDFYITGIYRTITEFEFESIRKRPKSTSLQI